MLVVALFIIIVIAALAASLSRILSANADSIANEVYSAKAYYTAESGAEFGIHKVLTSTLVNNACPPASDLGFSVSNKPGFENCSVDVRCDEIDLDDGSGQWQYYIVSTATCAGSSIIAEHDVEVEVKR